MLWKVFKKLDDANLTVNLVKSDFIKAHVDYLGYTVGQGKVKQFDTKVKDIMSYPSPISLLVTATFSCSVNQLILWSRGTEH